MRTQHIEALIKKVIIRHVNPREALVFLFGSRAGRLGRLTSDYDIGIYRGRKIPLRLIAKIKDELEDYPIPVNIDIVDFSTVSDDFKQLALKKIKIWNKPKVDLKLI